MQLFPGTYCNTLPNSWKVGEICKRRGVSMQGKGAACNSWSTAATTTGFRSVKPRKPISEYDMLGALIISCGRMLFHWRILWTVLVQGLWSSGPSLYGM